MAKTQQRMNMYVLSPHAESPPNRVQMTENMNEGIELTKAMSDNLDMDEGYLKPVSSNVTFDVDNSSNGIDVCHQDTYENDQDDVNGTYRKNQSAEDGTQQDYLTTNTQAAVSNRVSQQQPNNSTCKTLRRKQEEYSVIFGTFERPPWYMVILIGFQHYIIMFGATSAFPLLLSSHLCLQEQDTEAIPEIIGTTFFCCGIATILQSVVGVRLPIIQGGSFTYLAPIVAIMDGSEWTCPTIYPANSNGTHGGNATTTEATLVHQITATADMSTEMRPWKLRMMEIQGAIILASVVEMLIGFSGILELILQWIGPLVVTPTITLIGIGLFSHASTHAAKNWPIALLTICLIALFSQYTRRLKLPICHYSKDRGFTRATMPVFLMLPVILSILASWAVYAILVKTNVISEPDGENAATQIKLQVLENSPWYSFPFPCKWGFPTFSITTFVGVLAGVIASIVESIGDYFACAKMSGVQPPPVHAISRGIGMEGIGTLIFGLFGCGTGTTSYGENIGAIGVSKVASRRVIQAAALIMIAFGIFTKLGSLFVKIPEPVAGGVFVVMFGMICGIGLSNLQYVDLNSTRNLFIIGLSFFMGMSIPRFISGIEDTQLTGVAQVDLSIKLLLKTSMLVGGLTAFILDVSIPGSKRERGLQAWRKHNKRYTIDGMESKENIYDLPFLAFCIQDRKWARYVPFLPTFRGIFKKKTDRNQ